MTDTVPDETVVVAPASEPSGWSTRATALAIDLIPGSAVFLTMGMAALALPFGGVRWWLATILAALAFLATEINRTLLPAITGWSLGRAFTGIAVVSRDSNAADGAAPPLSAARLMLRELAHVLDTVPLLLGWFWPRRDKRRRTFADIVARTEVHPSAQRERPQGIRFLTMAVFVAAATVSLIGAGAGYASVYLRDHRSEVARAEIERQGPKIVADMLSYDPETLQEDFERAQSLATEKYREQLVPQQEAIRKATPVPNFYRVTDAAVLDAAPHRATLLLFLQGQRGKAGKERLISATVRVAFLQAQGHWRVDDLAVVSRPLPAEGGR